MTTLFKYPSTPHLPWSEQVNSDDYIGDCDHLIGKRVIVTEKMDGENTSLYSDKMHARSLDSQHNATRDWVKAYWSSFKHLIPEGYKICGENMFAKHSIEYNDLESYFYAFSVWNGNVALSWDAAIGFLNELGIIPAPILYDGIYDSNIIKSLYDNSKYNLMEGYVVRNADSFHLNDFDKNVFKFVRKNHVQTDQHWMHQKIVPNKLRK